MTRYRITCRCTVCFHKWKYDADRPDIADPPCPVCAAEPRAPIGLDIAAGRAPAIGGSNIVKAMDFTAKMTMEDHGLTDLQSDGRPGATMAPKLTPSQQAAADAMFAPAASGMKFRPGGPIAMAHAAAAAARAGQGMGAFAPPSRAGVLDPIATVQAPRTRPPVHFVASDTPVR